jgi:hypothetical protein
MALTTRSRKFAQLVASGLLQTDAHDVAYGPGKGKRKSKQQEASKLAARPDVREAIERYEREFTPIANYRAVRQEMESVIRSIAHDGRDDKARLAAARMLHEIATEREERERASAKTVTIDALISELGQLAPPPVLEMETVPDDGSTPAAEPDEAEPAADEEAD